MEPHAFILQQICSQRVVRETGRVLPPHVSPGREGQGMEDQVRRDENRFQTIQRRGGNAATRLLKQITLRR